MAQLRSPTLVTLGRMVRTFRDAAGLTQKEFAKKLGYTNGWVSNVENAQLRPRSEQVTAMERSLGVPPGALMNIYEQLDGEFLPGWFREWVDEETRAEVLRTFQLVLVPGLLQTEDYARAVIIGNLPMASEQDVEARVRVRMERQAVLAKDDPLRLWAVVDEAALRRQVGGARIMHEQLTTLLAAIKAPHVTVQVIPYAAGAHAGMQGSFVLMDFPNPADPALVYIDSMAGDLFLEAEADVRRYSLIFDNLRAVALSPADSAGLITTLAEPNPKGGADGA
jgi:transcriptional regulator with XRE-family HTH domain